jgi:hypothetical protein
VATSALFVLAMLGFAGVASPAAALAGDTIIVTTTIQAAVDAAQPGDTILVPPGTYRESVLVNKSHLTITGSPAAVIDAEGFPTGIRVGTGRISRLLKGNTAGIHMAVLPEHPRPFTDDVVVERNQVVRNNLPNPVPPESGDEIGGVPTGVGIVNLGSDHVVVRSNNLLAVPVAAGVLAWAGIILAPAVGAVLMSASTIVVALNAQLLRRLDLRPRPA